MNPVITVFGSSRPSPGSKEYAAAYDTGRFLAANGFTVCNGGYWGTMEASSKGAKEAGGATIGVTSSVFPRKANPWVDQEIRTDSMIERLMKLMELGQGYIVLKGGTGTLLELAAVWEFINKGFQKQKPVFILGPFWSPVIDTMRGESVWDGSGDCTSFVKRIETPEECADDLRRLQRLA